jgi:hypothetical protein
MVLPHIGALPFRHPQLHELDQLFFCMGFGHGRRFDAVDQARAAVRALVPGIHFVQGFIRLVNGKHRTFGQHVQVHIGDDHGHFDNPVGVRLQAGHFHINPHQIELFWRGVAGTAAEPGKSVACDIILSWLN